MHDCVFLVTINNSVAGQFSIELWIKRSVHVIMSVTPSNFSHCTRVLDWSINSRLYRAFYCPLLKCECSFVSKVKIEKGCK